MSGFEAAAEASTHGVEGRILIGTAGWSIPRQSAHRFPTAGTHLARYARALSCAEINSSFYRPHAAATYAKWAAATPAAFRFAVKLSKTITHELKLRRSRVPLEQFLADTSALAEKRGAILVQLPPSLDFDARVAGRFFDCFRERYAGSVVCEPRHPGWFTTAADRLLCQYHVARVAADPSRAANADVPGGWPGLVYFRLHGSPRVYWSAYSDNYLEALARTLRSVPRSADAWCVFDNTASGAAIENAWALQRRTVADGSEGA